MFIKNPFDYKLLADRALNPIKRVALEPNLCTSFEPIVGSAFLLEISLPAPQRGVTVPSVSDAPAIAQPPLTPGRMLQRRDKHFGRGVPPDPMERVLIKLMEIIYVAFKVISGGWSYNRVEESFYYTFQITLKYKIFKSILFWKEMHRKTIPMERVLIKPMELKINIGMAHLVIGGGWSHNRVEECFYY